jgi:adenosine deaminase
MNLHEFARRMPKVELHVHLEGSIRPATLLQLAERNGIDLPVQGIDGLRDFYRFRDFAHFIEVYVTITRCLKTPDDYRLIAYEFGANCARQNVRYAETTFSICTNVHYAGLPWQAILEGLNEGRAQAHAAFGVDWGWVFDIVRDVPETQNDVVEIALAAQDDGVVALGLGGGEKGFPPELFVKSFERARQGGLRSVPHAGEIAGPKKIWSALRLLQADRIGHGVRCVEDPALVAYLREHQVPLEMCPTSNVCLGVYPSYEAHPLRQLWNEGLLITVNSDDPPMFETNLNHEYEVLIDHFGFSAAELEQVSLNAVRASFLSQAEKTQLENRFRAEIARLRQELH